MEKFMFYLFIAVLLLIIAVVAHFIRAKALKVKVVEEKPSRQNRGYDDFETASPSFAFGAGIAGIVRAVAIGLFVALTAFCSIHQVRYGNVGIVRSFGALVGQTTDGLVTTWPWQDLERATVQIQGHKFESLNSFSSETQDVFVAATLNIRISPEHIQRLYRTVGPDYFDILVAPRVRQAFKDETVKYTSVQIAPHREAIRRSVRERLTLELRANSIIVEDLLIDDIKFSDRFQQSIEAKQAETQLALQAQAGIARARNLALQAIERERGVGEAALARAQKEAEANRVVNSSITPELIQYRMVDKLAPNVQVMMIPSGANIIVPSPATRR